MSTNSPRKETGVAIFQHPLDATETVEGIEVQAGEILQKGDVYSALSGKWEEIQEAFIGSPATPKERQGQFAGRTAIIVRPYK